VTGGWRNHDVAVDQRDNVLHLAAELSEPFRVVVFLFLFAGRKLRPYAVNEPDGMRGVREIPAPQRRVKVRRMDRVDAYRVRSHLRHQCNPPVIRAVVRRKL